MDAERAVKRMASYMQQYDHLDSRTWAQMRDVMGHAAQLFDVFSGFFVQGNGGASDEGASRSLSLLFADQVLRKMSSYSRMSSDFPSAKRWIDEALVMLREHGGSDTAMGLALLELGCLERLRDGDAENTERLLLEALETLRNGRSNGGTAASVDIAWALICTGQFYDQKGDERAESLLNEALEMLRKLDTPHHGMLSKAHLCLADASRREGYPFEAEQQYHTSLEEAQNAFGTNIQNTLIGDIQHNLGLLKKRRHDHEGALGLFEESLQIDRAVHGTADVRGAAIAMWNIASVRQDQGNLDGAEEMLSEALRIFKGVYGEKSTSRHVLQVEEQLTFLKDLPPLVRAAWVGDVPSVANQLEEGAEIEVTAADGSTALSKAAATGHLGVVKLLLEKGANAEAATATQRTALHYAAANGHTDVAKLLLEIGVNAEAVEAQQATPLHFAAQNGHTDVAKLLLEKGANAEAVEAQHWTPLHLAAAIGHTDVAKLLLAKGANAEAVEAQHLTPLHLAAVSGHTDVAKLLLEKSANAGAATATQRTPLYYAAANGHTDVAKLLLEKGANAEAVEAQQWTPLHFAAQNGHTDVAKLLLEKSANAGAATATQRTPLHYAAANGHTDVAKLLLEKGVNAEAVEAQQWTPLHFAAQN
eukprot:scaffold3964_cov180-Pinguiococcus_pyrenoidosus.AAC.1